MAQMTGGTHIHPEVKRNEDLLEVYSSAAVPWQIQAKDDEDFANGAQWSKEAARAIEAKNMFPAVVNVIGPTVEQGVAMLTANAPKFTSTAREDADTKTGKMFADLLAYHWDVNNGNVELKEAIYDYYTRGIGYLCSYYDPNADFGQGQVTFKALDPFDVYVDPNSRDRFFSDAANIVIATIQTKEQIALAYPDFLDQLEQAETATFHRGPGSSRFAGEGQLDYDQFMDTEHDHYEVIDRYTKIKVNQYRVSIPALNYMRVFDEEELQEYRQIPTFAIQQGSDTEYALTDTEIATARQLYEQYGETSHLMMDPTTGQQVRMAGPEHEGAIPGTTMTVIPTTFGELIELGVVEVATYDETRIKRVMSVGGVLLFDGILPISDYPIVPLCNHHHRNPFCDSDVRKARPLQEFINKMRSLTLAHATNSTSTKVLLPRGSVSKEQLELEWGKAGTSVIEFEAELGQPVVAGPVPLPNELYHLEQQARSEIEFVFGIWQLMHGNSEKAPATYKGTMAIEEFGQRRIKAKRDDIEAAINHLASVVVQMIQKYYQKPRVFRLVQPSADPKDIRINVPVYDDLTKEVTDKLNDVTVGRYDVIVVSGSTLPSNRWAKFEYYMQLYQAGIIDDIEVLKQTEVASTQAVLERKSIYSQLQGALQQAQETISKLEGDLQTAEREAVHANKKAELEKWKGQLAALKSNLQRAGERTVDKLQLLLDFEKQKASLQNQTQGENT